MTQYEPVIGLEVHAQLKTNSKLFCGCSTAFGANPNAHTCPVCTGQPGALPVLNRQAVTFAIRAGLALNCNIAATSVFSRKNYFYPDLPKGYQISQFDLPICIGGKLTCSVDDTTKTFGITRIHMEEDAGKSTHDIGRSDISHVDLNRSSVPLIEIVSEPEMRSSADAIAYLKAMRSILMYLEICDGNMQEGSLRCDANVSVRPVGQAEFGTRTELKNINSFRYLDKAINYEIERQIAVVESGESVTQETRLWDEKNQHTRSMRGKEEAHDYRYFPDPDLLPLHVSSTWIDTVRTALPELPEQRVTRYVNDFGMSEYDARVLTTDKALADYFESASPSKDTAKPLTNWISTELLGRMNAENKELSDIKIQAQQLGSLVGLITDGTISGKIAKQVFEEMYETGEDPEAIVKSKGLVQISDTSTIEPIIDDILAKNADNVAAYRAGKVGLLGFFVGQAMKATKGQANPGLVNKLLKEKLES